VEWSIQASQTVGVVNTYVNRISKRPEFIQLFFKKSMTVPVDMDATTLHLPPRQTRKMLDMKVFSIDLWEEHPFKLTEMFPGRGGVMIATGKQNLPYFQPLAEMPYL
jgi:hypothetical protein